MRSLRKGRDIAGEEGALAGSARLVLLDSVALLRPDEPVFEGMLEAWRSQGLARSTLPARERHVRAFQAHAAAFPREWTALHADVWFADMRAVHHCTRSTVRGYQVAVRGFCSFALYPAYVWAVECMRRFGTHPVQIITDVNSAQHVGDVESEPVKRPITRRELQDLFDYADEQVDPRPDGHRWDPPTRRQVVVLHRAVMARLARVPEQREIFRLFITWHYLRVFRARLDARGELGYAVPQLARHQLRTAAAFVAGLDEQGRSLADTTRPISTGSSPRAHPGWAPSSGRSCAGR